MMPMSSVNPLSFSLQVPKLLDHRQIHLILAIYPYIRISPSIHHSLVVFVGCHLPFATCHRHSITLFTDSFSPFFLLILCSMLGPMPSPRVLLNQRLSRCFDVCAPGLVGDCGGCSNVGCTRPWVHHSVSTSGRIGVHWPMIHWPNAWETHTNKQIQKCRVTPVYCGWF